MTPLLIESGRLGVVTMYAEVRERLRKNLVDGGIDVYIAVTPANIYYASGFRSSFVDLSWQMTGTDMVVVPTDPDKEPAIIVSDYCRPDAAAQSDIADIRTYTMWTENRSYADVSGASGGPDARIVPRPEQYDPDEIFRVVKSILDDRSLAAARIGSDLALMKHGTYQALRRVFPDNDLVDCESILYETRRIKHADEVRRLRRAALLFDAGFENAIAEVHAGQTLDEIRVNFEAGVTTAQRINPAEGLSEKIFFFPHIGKGSNTVVKTGDIVKLDCGAKVDGYWSDACRYVCLGPPNTNQQRVHDALLAGFETGLSMIKPGAVMGDIYDAVIGTVRAMGLPNYSRGHFGHSVGMDDQVEEPPFIGPNESVLEAGMVICLEVPFYPADVGGFNIEDVILVTEDGYETLTNRPRDLRAI